MQQPRDTPGGWGDASSKTGPVGSKGFPGEDLPHPHPHPHQVGGNSCLGMSDSFPCGRGVLSSVWMVMPRVLQGL